MSKEEFISQLPINVILKKREEYFRIIILKIHSNILKNQSGGVRGRIENLILSQPPCRIGTETTN